MPPTIAMNVDESQNEVTSHLDAESFWTSAGQSRLLLLEQRSGSSSRAALAIGVQERWDRELAAAGAVLASLQRSRNKVSPINTLPIEVLGRIFQIVRALKPAGKGISMLDSDFNKPEEPDLGWIVVSHVCHHWYQVASSFHALWTDIRFTLGKDWALRMMNRSGNMPIVFKQHCRKPRAYLRPSHGAIAQHTSHMRVLDLKAGSKAFNHLFPLLQHPAPILESLELTYSRDVAKFDDEYTMDLPDDIFATSTPYLRRLVLRNLAPTWPSPIINGLTYLEVRFPDIRDPRFDDLDGVRPEFENLLDTLARLPDLETLILAHVIPLDAGSERRKIHFPRLRRFVLHSRAKRCDDLLSFLEVPATADTEIVCTSLKESGEGLIPLGGEFIPLGEEFIPLVSRLSHLSGGCKSTTTKLPLKLVFKEIGNHILVETSDKREDIDIGGFVNSTPNLRFECHRIPPQERESLAPIGIQVFNYVCRAINVGGLRCLHLQLPEALPPLEWQLYDEQMPRLTLIETAGGSAVTIAEVLSESSPSNTGNIDAEKQYLPFPRLRILGICNTHFERTQLRHTNTPLWEALPSLLQARQKSNKPLRYLKICECTIRRHWVNLLEDVIKVDWDSDKGEYFGELDSNDSEDAADDFDDGSNFSAGGSYLEDSDFDVLDFGQ